MVRGRERGIQMHRRPMPTHPDSLATRSRRVRRGTWRRMGPSVGRAREGSDCRALQTCAPASGRRGDRCRAARRRRWSTSRARRPAAAAASAPWGPPGARVSPGHGDLPRIGPSGAAPDRPQPRIGPRSAQIPRSTPESELLGPVSTIGPRSLHPRAPGRHIDRLTNRPTSAPNGQARPRSAPQVNPKAALDQTRRSTLERPQIDPQIGPRSTQIRQDRPSPDRPWNRRQIVAGAAPEWRKISPGAAPDRLQVGLGPTLADLARPGNTGGAAWEVAPKLLHGATSWPPVEFGRC